MSSHIPYIRSTLDCALQEDPDKSCQIYLGDCIDVMEELPAGCVDLVFADPPFNVGYEYDQYVDSKTRSDYIAWTGQWLMCTKRILRNNGSIFVAIGTSVQAEVKCMMNRVGFHWRDTLVWHYTFGPHQKSRFTPSWVAIHYAVKDPKRFTWNPKELAVPSARETKYNDKRAKAGGKTPDNVWILDPSQYGDECFTPMSNAILESRVAGTFKERVNHPCQMPVAVLDRIIKATTYKGDIVFDPFLGSGTTAVSALGLGRRAWGVELSQNYLDNCVFDRVKRVLQENWSGMDAYIP